MLISPIVNIAATVRFIFLYIKYAKTINNKKSTIVKIILICPRFAIKSNGLNTVKYPCQYLAYSKLSSFSPFTVSSNSPTSL